MNLASELQHHLENLISGMNHNKNVLFEKYGGIEK
jgi:hypothetical protein